MPIRFEILDVGHGFCSFIEAENRNLILIDCGEKTDPYFSPAKYLQSIGQRSIERLFITNYDEDHINNLPDLRSKFPIKILHRNKSISLQQLIELKKKTGPISSAMNLLIDMINVYTQNEIDSPSFPNIKWTIFHHSFATDFIDTNNISLVIFFQIRNTTILIPGDLENSGWIKHLENYEFKNMLKRVNIFVASHHGRESGFCQDVFNYCKPDVIIISDGEKQFATQEMINQYAYYASGIQFNGQSRKVITTRKDGGIQWNL